MKKFEFNLEKLLSFKDQSLDSELMTLAILNSELKEAEDRLDALEEQKQKCKQDFENKMAGNVTPAAFQVYNSYQEFLSQQIKNCVIEINHIKKKIEDQIERIKELKIETKTLETLKEYRYEEYVKEGIKKSELEIEQFVTTTKLINMSY
ncbi:MAG: hypothetical protein GX076_02420 [Clostridiales bacterium]|jgi:flagellar export protein FliJ|nr:hypothetical protein [Clostridiales bacterium]